MKYLYGLIICILIPAFFALGYISRGVIHKDKDPVTIIKNVDKPVYKTVYVPQGEAEWKKWAESPILIDRQLNGDIYSIYAHDGYKESRVADKIQVSSFGDWRIYVGVSAAVVLGAGFLSLSL